MVSSVLATARRSLSASGPMHADLHVQKRVIYLPIYCSLTVFTVGERLFRQQCKGKERLYCVRYCTTLTAILYSIQVFKSIPYAGPVDGTNRWTNPK